MLKLRKAKINFCARIATIGENLVVKKPDLTIIKSRLPSTGIEPPRPLDGPGRGLWDRVQREYRITDVTGVETLQLICEGVDLIALWQAQIKADGATIRTRTGIKQHPASKMLLAMMAFVTRNLRALNLDVEPLHPSVGRPPNKSGW
jgi:hypothetical protein